MKWGCIVASYFMASKICHIFSAVHWLWMIVDDFRSGSALEKNSPRLADLQYFFRRDPGGPHGNRTHIVWGYPGYPRTSLCLITVFGADTTISSWFSSTISTTIFPWSVASLGYEYGHRYTEESRRLGIRWSKVWPSDYSGFCYLYPLVTLWFMSENSYWSHGPVEIVDLPIKHGDFP